MRNSIAIALALSFPLAAQTTATVTIDCARDNTIWERDATCCSNGAGTGLFIGSNGVPEAMRALLWFDVAAEIPASATITSVQLEVRCVRTRTAPNNTKAHRVLADWGEGPSFASGGQGGGATSVGDDANWFVRNVGQGTMWANPGADYTPASLSATTIVGVGTYFFPSSPAFVADVQDWLTNPATNFGIILIGTESPGNATSKKLNSREAGGSIPRLHVTFTGPAASWSAFGNPCDSLGTPAPSLAVDATVGTGQPTLGSPMRLQVTQGTSILNPAALFLSGTVQTTPIVLPAPLLCELHISPIAWSGAVDTALGQTFNVPFRANMIGLAFHWQSFGMAPGSRLVATNAVTTTFGL